MIEHRALLRHFRRVDPVLVPIIERAGPAELKPQRNRFQRLVRAIVSQQISTAAARTIHQRLADALAPQGIRPETLLELSVESLRTLGISRPKAGYLLELAERCHDGRLSLARLSRKDDEAIIDELTQVKGIGRWSAQMFLIFALGRPDVFPPGDLGIRVAIQRLYGFSALPTPAECLPIGARWSPYASLGSWYCWRSLEFPTDTGQ